MAALVAVLATQWSAVNWQLLHQDRWLAQWSGGVAFSISLPDPTPEKPAENN